MAERVPRVRTGQVISRDDWNAICDAINELHTAEETRAHGGVVTLAATACVAAASAKPVSRRALLSLGWKR